MFCTLYQFLLANYQNNYTKSFSGNSSKKSKGTVSVHSSIIGSPNLKNIKNLGNSNIVPQHYADEVKPGDRIKHSKFGIGVIDAIDSVSGEPSIVVTFRELGVKRLLLRFAKFDIL